MGDRLLHKRGTGVVWAGLVPAHKLVSASVPTTFPLIHNQQTFWEEQSEKSP